MQTEGRTTRSQREREADVASPTRSPGSLGIGSVWALQRAAGNKAVSDLIDGSFLLGVIENRGRPLSQDVRSDMERALGHDFTTVRVHDGPQASASAASIDAAAYTIGENIVLGSGSTLEGEAGRWLLAHELAHVVQQRRGPVDGVLTPGGLKVSQPGDRFERAAVLAADAVSAGVAGANPESGPTSAGSAEAVSVQRAPKTEEERRRLAAEKQRKAEEKKRLDEERRLKAIEAKLEKQEKKANEKAEKKAARARAGEAKTQEKVNKAKRAEARQLGVANRSEAMAIADKEAKQAKEQGPDVMAPSVANLYERWAAVKREEIDLREQLLAQPGMTEDRAAQEAWDRTWGKADPMLRAHAPMRSTAAERLASAVGEYRAEYRSQASALKEAKDSKKHGTLLKGSVEKLYDKQEEFYQEALAAKMTPEAALRLARSHAWWNAPEDVIKRRPDFDSAMDKQAMLDARQRVRSKKLVELDKLDKAGKPKTETARRWVDRSALGTTVVGEVPGAASDVTRPMAKRAIGKPGHAPHDRFTELPGEAGDVMAYVDDGLVALGDLCQGTTDLLRTTSLVMKVVEEPKTTGNVLETATGISKQLQDGVKVLVKAIGVAADAVSVAIPAAADGFAWAIPGVDIVASITALVPLVLQLATDGSRLTDTNVHLIQARGRGMDPSKTDALVFPLYKFQSVYTQRVEKGSFAVARQLVNISAGITKLAASAAFGAGAYAGYAIHGASAAVGGLHSMAHTVADEVMTWQAKQARKDFGLKLEGSAETLFTRDASYAVDGIIALARKKDPVALSFLATYGFGEKDVDAPGDQLHKALMKKIKAQEEPKMVWEKLAGAATTVRDTVVDVGKKGAQATELWERRHGGELGEDASGWEKFGHGMKRSAWITKMAIKNICAPKKFQGNVRRTDVAQWEAHAGDVVLTWQDVSTPPDYGRDKVEAFNAAVDKMSVDELRSAAERKEHNEIWKQFFSEVLAARLREEAMPALPTKTW